MFLDTIALGACGVDGVNQLTFLFNGPVKYRLNSGPLD